MKELLFNKLFSSNWIFSVIAGLSLIAFSLMWQSGIFAQVFSSDPAPAVALDCQVGAPVGDCHTERGTGHQYCEWTENGNQAGPCQVETCFNGGTPPDCGGGSNPQPTITQTLPCMTNSSLCGENTQFCENTTGGGSATIFKHAGVCDPTNGAHDENGCIFLFDNVRSFTGLNCTDVAAPTATPIPPAQVTPTPTSPPAVSDQFCFLCDGGTLRRAGTINDCTSTNAPACPSIGGPFNACLSSTDNMTGVACGSQPATPTPTSPAPTATPTPTTVPGVTVTPSPTSVPAGGAVVCAPGQVMTVSGSNVICLNVQQSQTATGGSSSATGGSSSSTSSSSATGGGGGSSTVNVTAAGRSVPAGQTLVKGAKVKGVSSGVTVSELPKTGLPLVGWVLAGLLPAGFGLRRFSKEGSVSKDSTKYIWQKREFDR